MNAKQELEDARRRLQKVRDRMLWLRDEVERIEAKVESGEDYPSFQTESFVNDDLLRRAGHMRELESLEVRERELEMDVRAWRNTVNGS